MRVFPTKVEPEIVRVRPRRFVVDIVVAKEELAEADRKALTAPLLKPLLAKLQLSFDKQSTTVVTDARGSSSRQIHAVRIQETQRGKPRRVQ